MVGSRDEKKKHTRDVLSLILSHTFLLLPVLPYTPHTLSTTANKNHLELRSNSPQWVYSTAPLVKPDGTPVDAPQAGAAGYAMALNDKQVREGGLTGHVTCLCVCWVTWLFLLGNWV